MTFVAPWPVVHKPRLRFANGYWQCGPESLRCLGRTPKEAYQRWLVE